MEALRAFTFLDSYARAYVPRESARLSELHTKLYFEVAAIFTNRRDYH